MLRHLYGSRYKDDELDDLFKESKPMASHIAGSHLSVFMLGDKYDIDSLRYDAAKRFEDLLDLEAKSGSFFDGTIQAIQRLLGPDTPLLADRTLLISTTQFIDDNMFMLFADKLFRDLLAEGVMLNKDLAIGFLQDIQNNI
jgi:hypothetical protein